MAVFSTCKTYILANPAILFTMDISSVSIIKNKFLMSHESSAGIRIFPLNLVLIKIRNGNSKEFNTEKTKNQRTGRDTGGFTDFRNGQIFV